MRARLQGLAWQRVSRHRWGAPSATVSLMKSGSIWCPGQRCHSIICTILMTSGPLHLMNKAPGEEGLQT